jgi:hypothetical protein
MLAMVGCDNKAVSLTNTNDTKNDFEEKMVELEQTIKKQQAIIDEHEEKLTNLIELNSDTQLSILEESNFYINNKLYVLETLIDQITTYKTAMLTNAEINGETLKITITYTDIVSGDGEPNGFRLVETGEGTKVLTLTKDVPIFLLKNPGESYEAPWNEVVGYQGFLQLFEKEGKIVFISETYLP